MDSNSMENLKWDAKHWYLNLISGFFFLIMAVLLVINPEFTYEAIIIYFALTFLVNGLTEIGFALANWDSIPNKGWVLVGGIIDLLLGGYLLANPVLTANIIPVILGFMILLHFNNRNTKHIRIHDLFSDHIYQHIYA